MAVALGRGQPRALFARAVDDVGAQLPTQHYQTGLLHLCSGIAAGLAAIHSLKIAHRDINSPNIFLDKPKPGQLFPEPIVADFNIARALEDNSRFQDVNGYSPRYAAPEVIVRIHVQVSLGAPNRMDDYARTFALTQPGPSVAQARVSGAR